VQEVKSSYLVDETLDPLSEDCLEDPYPYYVRFNAKRRSTSPKINMWVVSRYEDILNIVKDSETFSNARVQEPLQPLEPDFLRLVPREPSTTSPASLAESVFLKAREP
jgi:cytochrome P450